MQKIIKNNQKGMFFTLGAFFLLSSLVTMALIANTQLRVKKSFVLDRLQDLSNSVEQSIKEIFYTYYDANVILEKYNADGTLNVTFIEKISREKDEWGEEFGEKIENFKAFVESEDENTKINITMMKDKELPLVIEPHNITYSRYWGTGHVILKVNPETINFNSYDILVDSRTQEIDIVTSQFRDAGDFLFRVIAVDNYGNSFIEEELIDASDKHQVQIFFVGGNKVKIDLDNTQLEMWTNTPNKIEVSTKMANLMKTNQKVKIKLFQGAINISFPFFEVEKIASLNIAEE